MGWLIGANLTSDVQMGVLFSSTGPLIGSRTTASFVVNDMSYSNVEICQWSYDGETNKVKHALSSNCELAHKTDQDGRTALHWASSAGTTEVCKLLIANGAKVCQLL